MEPAPPRQPPRARRLANDRRTSRASVHPLSITSPAATITPDGDSAPRRGEVQPEAGTGEGGDHDRVRDYAKLEREYITGTMSLRELCRRHGVAAHSAVVVQARQGNWAEKRGAYRDRSTSTFIEQHADHIAAHQAQIRDHALDAIDEAITKLRADLWATEKKLIDGEWVEVPAMRMTPKDLAILIDRFQILFGRPSMISEGRGFAPAITPEPLTVEVLRGIVEATRGLADTPAPEASPLPRLGRRTES